MVKCCVATHPLLVSRWIGSDYASQGPKNSDAQTVMTINFSRAFLYGKMEREVCIELPELIRDDRKETSWHCYERTCTVFVTYPRSG